MHAGRQQGCVTLWGWAPPLQPSTRHPPTLVTSASLVIWGARDVIISITAACLVISAASSAQLNGVIRSSFCRRRRRAPRISGVSSFKSTQERARLWERKICIIPSHARSLGAAIWIEPDNCAQPESNDWDVNVKRPLKWRQGPDYLLAEPGSCANAALCDTAPESCVFSNMQISPFLFFDAHIIILNCLHLSISIRTLH